MIWDKGSVPPDSFVWLVSTSSLLIRMRVGRTGRAPASVSNVIKEEVYLVSLQNANVVAVQGGHLQVPFMSGDQNSIAKKQACPMKAFSRALRVSELLHNNVQSIRGHVHEL